jgi:hypothetical protein
VRILAIAVALHDLVGAIEAVHHVGHPSGARLQKAHAKLLEAVEHPLHHEARDLDHLRERMLERDGHREVGKGVEAEVHRRRTVRRDRHVEAFGLLVYRPEVGMAEAFAHAEIGAVRGQHGPHHS